MDSLLRRHPAIILSFLALALFTRLYCTAVFPGYTDDSVVYDRLAHNLRNAGTLSISDSPPLIPTDMRTPGYPIFLAGAYTVFGHDPHVVRCLQAIFDLLTCLLVMGLAVQVAPEKFRDPAALAALALAAVCPFLAEYTAFVLTESLAVFLSTLAFFLAVGAARSRSTRRWVGCGITCGLAVLVRPDCVLLVGAIVGTLLLQSIRRRAFREGLRYAVLLVSGLAVTLSPWVFRNAMALGKFQPLSTRYAETAGEYVPLGYFRWVRTWIDNGRYINAALWSLETREIDIQELPPSAFDTEEERRQVRDLFEGYNATIEVTPEWDAAFGAIAEQRIQRSPLRYYVWLPARRAESLWFDPRTETLPIQGQIFPVLKQSTDDPVDFTISLLRGLLNAAYLLAAALGAWVARKQPFPVALLLVAVVLRTGFLSTLENPEPRYVLELYPFVIAFAGVVLANFFRTRDGTRPGVEG